MIVPERIRVLGLSVTIVIHRTLEMLTKAGLCLRVSETVQDSVT